MTSEINIWCGEKSECPQGNVNSLKLNLTQFCDKSSLTENSVVVGGNLGISYSLLSSMVRHSVQYT